MYSMGYYKKIFYLITTGLLFLFFVPFMAAHAFAAAMPTTQMHILLGQSSALSSGDYISTSTANGGLQTYYSYFIEVPPSLSKLQIDIFDADIGFGDLTTGPRDRQRGGGWNTSVTYTLYDPTGAVRPTRFTAGNAAGPAGSDNAWLTLYSGTGNYVRDTFSTAAYNNNDGNMNWSTDWTETNDGATGPGGGAILITGGELRLTDGTDGAPFPSIQRQVDLSPTGLNLSIAYLSFSYRTSNNLENGDQISVQVSNNGGGSWTTLETFTNDSSGTRNYDITAFISNNTQIRFILADGYTGGEYFFVDNIEINDNSGGAITPGHWELRVDMGTSDDYNGIAIRAHDGDSTSGGTEINVYAESFIEVGINGTSYGISQNWDLYPFVTSGCLAYSNNFDWDGCGAFSYTSGTGSFTQTDPAVSGSTVWLSSQIGNPPASSWTTDVWSADYGIWTAAVNIYTCTAAGTSNYGTFYMGNSSALSPPPTSQPQPNTFRLYFPSDAGAGTAPVKTALTQTLSLVSGPNPPVSGSTTRVKVQITVFNPTPYAITFSSTNLVTANVPGGGAVYAGNASVSQGSITAQPAVGGTGNITWNPGIIPAGSSADILYDVDVTPTSAGQRIPVTATAANGTRATYVDETGNATQTRATHTYGPLCELAVTEGGSIVPTLASISSFDAFNQNGKVMIIWNTIAEIGTAGFYLYRKDDESNEYIQISKKLIPAILTSHRGGTYWLTDESASPQQTYTYLLEEVEARGNRRTYGPFTVMAGEKPATVSNASVFSSGYARSERGVSETQKYRLQYSNTSRVSPSPSPIPAERIKLAVNENGLYRIDCSQIASLLGLSQQVVTSHIQNSSLSIKNRGNQVAWFPSDDNASLYFYGEGNESIYTKDNMYWLEIGPGVTMEVVQGTGPATVNDAATFYDTIHFEQDNFDAPSIFSNPLSDYWFWDFIVAEDPSFGSKTFALDLKDVARSGNAVLTSNFHGGSDTSHHAIIRLNGFDVGEVIWNDISGHAVNLAFDPLYMREGDNELGITGILDAGVPYSVFYIDSFDVSYERYYRAVENALVVRAEKTADITVEGFSNSNIMVYETTNPLSPKVIRAVTIDNDGYGNNRVSFTASAGSAYFLLTPDEVTVPVSVTPYRSAKLKDKNKTVDYLIITSDEMSGAAQKLKEYRQNAGLSSMIVKQRDIMDEFNYGIYSPEALRYFLTYAYQNWKKAPHFVVLAGGGSYDYKNNFGFGGNQIPPLMIGSPDGLFPSDNYLADVNSDHIPDMAIGRLPAATPYELDGMINKIISYENSGSGSWQKHILMLADDPDAGGDFHSDSNAIAMTVPQDYSIDKIYLSEDNTPDEARQAIMNGILQGALLLNYLGHAGVDRLAQEGLMLSDDVPSMTNHEKLPVISAMTCMLGQFAIPGFDSLGVLLLLHREGGAIAVLSPTGMSLNSQAVMLNKAFYRSIFEQTQVRLGDIFLDALKDASNNGVSGYTFDIYNLLGDPASRLKISTQGTGNGTWNPRNYRNYD